MQLLNLFKSNKAWYSITYKRVVQVLLSKTLSGWIFFCMV
jgi:hypothetical protein